MLRSGLLPPQELSDDDSQALNAALQALRAREYTRRELFAKLCRRFSRRAALQALQRCVQEGWQSEERYAEMLYRHMQLKGFGPLKFRLEARRRGLDPAVLERTLAAGEWGSIARAFAAHKFGRENPEDPDAKKRILNTLARRGFAREDCFGALNFLCLQSHNHV